MLQRRSDLSNCSVGNTETYISMVSEGPTVLVLRRMPIVSGFSTAMDCLVF
jgi:hypothetical protein